ncbi:Calcineurin-like protein phosphoesterase, partial [Dinothrombium tinctorium]
MSRKSKTTKPAGMPSRTPSLESAASQTVAASPRIGRQATEDIYGGGVIAYGSHLFDCCSILIYCPKHSNFGLSRISSRKGLWMPFVALKSTEGWYPSTVARLKQLLVVGSGAKNFLSFSPPELLHVYRIQLPTLARFVTRITYFSQLTHDPKHPTNCCQSNKSLTWISAEDITNQNIADLWGPEPLVFGNAFLSNNIDRGAYTEFTLRDAMKYLPRDAPKTFQDELLKSAQFTEKDMTKVYGEFVQHVYPSQYMAFASFSDYMKRIGWTNNEPDLQSVFRAFAFNGQNYLSYHEFILGIAALDKNTTHGGRSGELRCGYIFRFYDANNDNLLDYNDMKALTYDMLKFKNKPCDDESVEKEMARNSSALGLAINDPINSEMFMKGVGTMLFRGSSALFRCSFSIIQQILLKRSYDSMSSIQVAEIEVGPGKKPRGTCPRCRTKKYILALHSVKLHFEGMCIDPQEVNQDDSQNLSKPQKTHEINQFSPDFLPNRMMDWIRDFAVAACGVRLKGKRTLPKELTWTKTDREKLSTAIIKLCQDAQHLLQKDGRVIK